MIIDNDLCDLYECSGTDFIIKFISLQKFLPKDVTQKKSHVLSGPSSWRPHCGLQKAVAPAPVLLRQQRQTREGTAARSGLWLGSPSGKCSGLGVIRELTDDDDSSQRAPAILPRCPPILSFWSSHQPWGRHYYQPNFLEQETEAVAQGHEQ